MSSGSNPQGSNPAKGAVRRYTVQFVLQPSGDTVQYRAVTPSGELMAVALATARLLRNTPEARVSAVEVTNVEAEFRVDPEEDALDYWGLE